MNILLPDLLTALAGIFAGPAALPCPVLEAAAGAAWAPPALRADLERLLVADGPDLAVAYADAFLLSLDQPVLHLEASVHRAGRLRDPALFGELDPLYAALGFEAEAGRSPDHLATELQALSLGLRRLGSADDGGTARLIPSLAALLDRHLHPLVEALRRLAETRPLHPAYASALAVVQGCTAVVREGVQAFQDRPPVCLAPLAARPGDSPSFGPRLIHDVLHAPPLMPSAPGRGGAHGCWWLG